MSECDNLVSGDPANSDRPGLNEFFGKLRHSRLSNGRRRVEVIVRPASDFGFELALGALALDGSRSMLRYYGAHLPSVVRRKRNIVQPAAQEIAQTIASNARGECAITYWACGSDGGEIEPVGILSSEQIRDHEFAGPEQWGGGSKLTPVVRYFWEQVFVSAYGTVVAVILTDGAWSDDDHHQLLQFTSHMSEEVATGRRSLMKLVLLGIKTPDNALEIDRLESRMNELDDFDTDVNIWDHKWIDQVRDWSEIFIDLIKDWSLGVGGKILDSRGECVLSRDEFNFGISFELEGDCPEFTLVLDGLGKYRQAIV